MNFFSRYFEANPVLRIFFFCNFVRISQYMINVGVFIRMMLRRAPFCCTLLRYLFDTVPLE